MEAKLIWSIYKKDDDAFPIRIDEKAEIFVEEKEIVRSEFYESMRSGVAVKVILVTRIEDYELSRHTDKNNRVLYADKVEYDGETYDIIRAYKKGKSKIELVCGEKNGSV